MSKLFLRYERLRWLFVNECSTMGCETLGTGEASLRMHIREENTWALRREERCVLGGGRKHWIHWRLLAIPSGKSCCDVRQPLWPSTSSPRWSVCLKCYGPKGLPPSMHSSSLRKSFVVRTPFVWSTFLRRARHGSMDHELYCFMHGLPARHTGSWIPDSDAVACGNEACQLLPLKWAQEMTGRATEHTHAMDLRTWATRKAEECRTCATERLRRCRLRQRLCVSTDLPSKFDDAPLIHAWNAPKYDAALIRAREFARRTSRILLWCVAEDEPQSTEHRNLLDEDLQAKRAEWIQFHDQKRLVFGGECHWYVTCRCDLPRR